MNSSLGKQVLELQESGIKLYGDLAEFFHWLGEKRMSHILKAKLGEAVDDNLATRFLLLDSGYSTRTREPPSNTVVTQLQWQEGTNEPEDEPNVSNGEDILPKKPPTRQPWEQPIVGISYDSAPKKEDIDKLYDEGLKRWLAYEKAATEAYQQLAQDNVLFEELQHEAERETACITDSLGAAR